jgi:hypothetical protein
VGKALYILIRLSLLWIVINIVTIALTRLTEMRYFSATVLLLILGAIAGVASILAKKRERRKDQPAALDGKQKLFLTFISLASFLSVFVMLYPQMQRDEYGAQFQKIYQDFKPFIEKDALVGCSAYADNIAYYTDWKTLYVPLNTPTPDENFIAWKRHFNVSYVIVNRRFTFQDSAGTKLLATSGEWKLLSIKNLN